MQWRQVRRVFCSQTFNGVAGAGAVDVRALTGPALPLIGRKPRGVRVMKYPHKKRNPALDITLSIVFVVLLVVVMMVYNAITEKHQHVPDNAEGITASAGSAVAAATAAANAAANEGANRAKAASQ